MLFKFRILSTIFLRTTDFTEKSSVLVIFDVFWGQFSGKLEIKMF